MSNKEWTCQQCGGQHAVIKLCPFCGKQPVVVGSGENRRGLIIECETPGCVNPCVSYYDHDTAINVWNQRAPHVANPHPDQSEWPSSLPALARAVRKRR